jgi:hypothetical protein
MVADVRSREHHECAAARDLHFHKQRLAFVDRRAEAIAHRLPPPVRRQTLLVECVPGLMEHRHEGLQEIVFAVAGSDAGVVGNAAAERVMAHVQAPALEVEAEHAHHFFAKNALAFARERPAQR